MSTRTLSAPAADLTADAEAVRLTAVDVVFRRRGAEPVRALTGLDLTIARGSVCCLLGPNGSGKTTTVNVLTGLLEPSAGSVRVTGLDPGRQRRDVLRRIALVPQETALYAELTGRENLEFHARYYGVPRAVMTTRIDEALTLVGLTDRATDRTSTYSGGMQRRLALARALLTEPEVLILDEPTLGVDVQSRQAIWERIEQLAADGRTVLLTTNYMEEADKLGRQVLILDHGRTVAQGSPAQLKAAVTRQRLRVAFASAGQAERARTDLADLSPELGSDQDLSVDLPADTERLDFLRQVLDRLATVGGVTGFRFDEPSLQDVFLHVTGRALRN
ncbi:ATP-binding cassette domain-containing protein [Plantactinospora sp. GCM10030261]|uniref:ABC transporter ATP-binding protein n=1 Tax=Plantactinospora sp. GCM10030261 TaxID=3273420 RepID=UPI00361E5CC4